MRGRIDDAAVAPETHGVVLAFLALGGFPRLARAPEDGFVPARDVEVRHQDVPGARMRDDAERAVAALKVKGLAG